MSLSNQLFKIIFWSTVKLRGESFATELAALKKSQYFSSIEIYDLQLRKLNELLKTCSSIAHYQNRLPLKLTTIEELSELPLLTKEEIRNNPDKLTSGKGIGQRLKTSGGSTGAPVTLRKNSRGVAQEMAAQWRGYEWAGVNIGDRQARFWGTPKNTPEKLRSKLIDFICHRIRITAFNYDMRSFQEAQERLTKFSPLYLYGYTSIISEFSDYLKTSKTPPPLSIKSIITTAEVLDEVTRSNIENTFNCKVYDEYGCGELGTIAHECEAGKLHVNSENLILEILDEKGNQQPHGLPGEIVVTDLTNHTMPLIRYRLMDYGTLSTTPCSCGRTLPVLEKVHGRQYDILYNNEGRKFHGEFFLYILEDARKRNMHTSGVQFVQDPDLSLTVNLVANDRNYCELEKYITRRLKADFDPNIKVYFKSVEQIPREASGKIRVVKSSKPHTTNL